MAGTLLGRLDWNLTKSKEGHRTYKIVWLLSTLLNDGPAIAMATAGLPAVGSTWAFGNDVDAWAFCAPDWKAKPVLTREKGTLWTVEQRFTTIPQKRCQDTSIENPLNEPDRISGSFTKYTREAIYDRHGNPFKSSSHEQIRGSVVERDDNRPNVSIEKTLSSLPLSTFAPMVDDVNDAALWGLSARMVKLSNISWSRHLYGTCTYYYTVNYEFDINYDTFDKVLIDEGTKVLGKGGNANDPRDFVVYKDVNSENTRVILDGSGAAWDGTGSPGTIDAEFYNESNFLLLNIPSSL